MMRENGQQGVGGVQCAKFVLRSYSSAPATVQRHRRACIGITCICPE